MTQAQGEEHRTRVLENFSFAQVIASALAAVTSVLLSQQIGVIGGLLGVAAGAAAATIATQLYRGMLDASADRLKKQMAPIADDLTMRMDASGAEETVEFAGAHLKDVDETEPITSVPAPRIATDTLIMRRIEKDRHQLLRMTAIVAAVSLVAVGLVALVINLATAGEGLGERVVIVQTPEAEEQVEETEEVAETDEATEQEGQDATAETAETVDPATTEDQGDQGAAPSAEGDQTDPASQPTTDTSATEQPTTDGTDTATDASTTTDATSSSDATTTTQP